MKPIPLPSLQVLLFCNLILFFIIIIIVWIAYCGRGTIIFLKEAHTNNTGRAGLKYIIASFLALLVGAMTFKGILFGKYPPESFLFSLLSAMTLLLGLGSADLYSAYKTGIVRTKKNEPNNIQPEVNKEF